MAGEYGYLETKSLGRCEVWVGETTRWHHIPYMLKVVRMKPKDVVEWKIAYEDYRRKDNNLAPQIFFGLATLFVLPFGMLAWEKLHEWFPSFPELQVNGWTVWPCALLVLVAVRQVIRAEKQSLREKDWYDQMVKMIFARYGVAHNYSPDYPQNPTGYVLLNEDGSRIQ